MKIKQLLDEDFVNYKFPAMFIGSCICDWKCCYEQGTDITTCQNSKLVSSEIIDISEDKIFRRYIGNPITKAIVIGGLEPMLQIDELIDLISYFRANDCKDTFVIYTGYYPEEITGQVSLLSRFKNIIIKFGRFIPNDTEHFDETLGVNLVSENQFAQKIC